MTQSSLVPFFDVPQAEPSSYSISAVDPAGNSSTAVGVTVVDSGLGVIDPNPGAPITEECASCPRGAAYVGAGVAGFAEDDGSEERITMCRPLGVTWECDQWAFTPVNGSVIESARAVTTGGRNLAYEDRGGGSAPDVFSRDMGFDLRPGTLDDGATYLITSDGQCPVMSTTRMVYAGGPAGSREIRWRSAGFDGIMGNGNDTDTALAASADFDGTRGCETVFTGRYVLWRDKRNTPAVYLYDLGADSTPNGSDPGEALVFSGLPLYFGFADDRILIQTEPDLVQVIDLGVDRLFGTSDDATTNIAVPGHVSDASGDKLLSTPDNNVSWFLHDIGSQTSLKIYDGTGTATAWDPMLGDGFVFGLVASSAFQAEVPAYLDFLQTSAAFHFDEVISVSESGGALDGELMLLGQDRVRNVLRGGSWSLP
ncbi:MAG: hypothetical protein AAF658_19610, partial [Myxococcota bacterium]